MTRIDFYLLATADAPSRQATACKLVEKAYRQGHRVYLHSGSEAETARLDDLLWTFRQGSFVPHELHPGAEPEAPVVIGHGEPPEGMADVLVNLAPEVPEGFERFARVAEFIDEDEAVKAAGRVRFRRYREAGFPPETHKLDSGAVG
jgi:DNA polymerase-3 subunit chi